jgi:hypothetical protein
MGMFYLFSLFIFPSDHRPVYIFVRSKCNTSHQIQSKFLMPIPNTKYAFPLQAPSVCANCMYKKQIEEGGLINSRPYAHPRTSLRPTAILGRFRRRGNSYVLVSFYFLTSFPEISLARNRERSESQEREVARTT